MFESGASDLAARGPRLRILTVTNWYPPHHFGGYELSCYDVMTRLQARGHAVDVLCSNERRPGVDTGGAMAERHVRRELHMYLRDGALLDKSVRERLAIERHNQQALARALAQVKPDVVSVWHMGALSIGLLTTIVDREIPMVYAICDDWLTYYAKLDRWAALFNGSSIRQAVGHLIKPLVGVPTTVPALNDTGAFCFVSEFTRGRAKRYSPWPTFPISTTVYSGIERSLFPAHPSLHRPWRWRLAYLGRLDPRKGIETAIRAVRELPPEASLAIYGPGSDAEHSRWERLVRELALTDRVSFGELQRPELAGALENADALVFPSDWEEPFGLTPVEAMACGTPVVATRRGGSAEFLLDGTNCVTFAPGDATGLAHAVRQLANDPELRHKLAERGLRAADELTADRLADVFELWHLAAAQRFRGELPPQRRLDL